MKNKALKLINEQIEWLDSVKDEHDKFDVLPTYYNLRGQVDMIVKIGLITENEENELILKISKSIE